MPSRFTPSSTPATTIWRRLHLGGAAVAHALVVVAAVPLMIGCSALATWCPRPPPASPDASLPYGAWRQKSAHNAYERGAPLTEQLARHRFRSVELDIHTGKSGRPTLEDDWYVYHVDFPGLDGSSCETLRECLREIEAFHRASPEHDVLTVFVDLKDDLAAPDHAPADLDALLRAMLRDALVEPVDLLARCPLAETMEDAVAGRCSWPALGELRGKIVVALTGGDLCADESRLRDYVGVNATRRAAFVAPEASDACPVDVQTQEGDVLFFNLARGSFHHAAEVARAGLVSRAYGGGLDGGLDDPGAWLEAASAGVNILATDRIDADRHPWTDVMTAPAQRAKEQPATAARPQVRVAGERSIRATR